MLDSLGRFITSVIEFIIAGVLFTSAVLITVHSFFPHNIDQAFNLINRAAKAGSALSSLLIFTTAYIYAVGLFAENVSRMAFEWRLDMIKEKRHEAHHQKTTYGNMRFVVMGRSPDMYVEVDSQLRRMRTERVLGLCQVIVFPAILHALIENVTPLTVFLTVLIVITFCLTALQINERFHRYCRAIERGYIEAQRRTTLEAKRASRP